MDKLISVDYFFLFNVTLRKRAMYSHVEMQEFTLHINHKNTVS